jgi:hypothetical protein
MVLDEGRRYTVSEAHDELVRMGRSHAVAAVIKDAAHLSVIEVWPAYRIVFGRSVPCSGTMAFCQSWLIQSAAGMCQSCEELVKLRTGEFRSRLAPPTRRDGRLPGARWSTTHFAAMKAQYVRSANWNNL